MSEEQLSYQTQEGPENCGDYHFGLGLYRITWWMYGGGMNEY